jgi:acetolactate synthase small subunit
MQYTLSILVENQAGVLSKISGLFSRRAKDAHARTIPNYTQHFK